MGVYLGRGDGGAVPKVGGPGVGGLGEGGGAEEQERGDHNNRTAGRMDTHE
jgi:hypothetical protein